MYIKQTSVLLANPLVKWKENRAIREKSKAGACGEHGQISTLGALPKEQAPSRRP